MQNGRTLFPTSPWDTSRPPKELVLGLQEGAEAAAYPFGMLDDAGVTVALNDSLGARPILVTYLGRYRTARAFDRRVNGRRLSFVVADENAGTFQDEQTGSLWDARGVAVAGPMAGAHLNQLTDAFTLFWFSWSVYHPDTRLPGL